MGYCSIATGEVMVAPGPLIARPGQHRSGHARTPSAHPIPTLFHSTPGKPPGVVYLLTGQGVTRIFAFLLLSLEVYKIQVRVFRSRSQSLKSLDLSFAGGPRTRFPLQPVNKCFRIKTQNLRGGKTSQANGRTRKSILERH